jgi:serine/threonine protein kinase
VITHNARTTKSDIWAVGVVLYEMIAQSIPWQHLPRPEMFNVIRASNLGVKDTCVHTNELLALMCCHEVDDRTSCNALMDHMLRMNIVDDWSDVVAKKHVAPVIPEIMRAERNTIPEFDMNRDITDFEMNRDVSSLEFSPLLFDESTFDESTFEDGGFGLDQRRASSTDLILKT